jgi:hypothetical protein
MTVGVGRLLSQTSVVSLYISRRLDTTYYLGGRGEGDLLGSPGPLDAVAPLVGGLFWGRYARFLSMVKP